MGASIMDKIYMQADGTPVYDLDAELGSDYKMSRSESQFLSDVGEFARAGFRISHKDNFPNKDGPNRDVDYDRYRPEASLVANENSDNAAISNGMIFLHSGLDKKEDVFLYLALDGKEANSFMDENNYRLKGEQEATLIELDDGDFFGYIKLERNQDADPGHEFDDSLQALREMELPAKPIPFSRDAMEFLPYFGRDGFEPDALEMEEIANILKDNLRSEVSAVEMPEIFLQNEVEQDYDYNYSPRMNRRLGH
jgi:hypothetical protein